MPTGIQTATHKRMAYLESRKMSIGMRPELKAIVVSLIEPAIKQRIISRDALTLSSAYQRESIAPIFDCVRMPNNKDGHKTLGEYMQTVDAVESIVSYLCDIKQHEEANGGWANTEEFSYLCDCIDLMRYVHELVKMGDEPQHNSEKPVRRVRPADIKVFCKCCYRYAESREVSARKNLKLCRSCREVAGDGQDYKQANLVIENYLKIKQIDGRNKTTVWLDLKSEQVSENRDNRKLSLMRELASDSCLSPEARYTAINELINLLPRLQVKLTATPSQAIVLDDLIAELLVKMEFSYAGIKPYFLANPHFMCGTLMRYDGYLLMTGVIEKQIKKKQSEDIRKIESLQMLLDKGVSKVAIAAEIGCTREYVYKLIKKHDLQSTRKVK